MNVKTVVAVALACSVVALSGCAGMKSKDSSALASSLSDDPANPIDLAYVSRINKQAKDKDIVVVWINPPHESTRPQDR